MVIQIPPLNYPVIAVMPTATLTSNVANVGGLQSQGVEGDVVVLYFKPLTTQNLKSSGVPEG
jgi:hypothetical protein